MRELAKIYDPRDVEKSRYEFWQRGGFFRAEPDPAKTPYTIVMPPPNITGQLHMGHALNNTLQDILARWRRMQGYDALWLPGTDHASIATEAKIVEAMREEGITKEDLGREKFLERAWEWKRRYGGRITGQIMELGSSCDWSRERFTMDEGCSRAVNEVFVRLYEKGLIYRGERIVNWCPKCLTSISDAEVEYAERDGSFWNIRYPLEDGSGHIEVATTRPETMLGDTAVAVHPEDARYAKLVGKNVILPIVNRLIPIIADNYVDPDFGTGAVKITPAHDPNDFEVGLRHGLPVINVMANDGKMNENAGVYERLDRYECRKRLVFDLEAGGFLAKTEPMKHNVGSCYRCHTTVEPLISKQWFVKMEPLAGPAIKAVKDGEIKFIPERFEKIYYNWMENIRDWCVSRQLWWGHRIPAWYCGECGEITVSRDEPAGCGKCGGKDLTRDPDTLDTWFSSALWPFSTLGWPEHTADLERYYPTSTLVTMYDIIFFWVARMIFSGLEHTGKIPFSTVFIHGMMRDDRGRKMSKSLDNGRDPLEEIEKYGADALRLALTMGVSPGNDMRYSNEKVEACRNFANKLWNAARFVLMNLDENEPAPAAPVTDAPEDRWVLSKYNALVSEVTDNLERFELGMAVGKLYDFIWDVYCDWYIELAKIRLQQGGPEAETAKRTLVFVLSNTLKLLHPFMPFITEEIWQALPHEGGSVMVSPWPEPDKSLSYPREEGETEKVMAVIRAVRNRRAEMNVPPSKKAAVYIETAQSDVFTRGVPFIKRLAWASEVYVGTGFAVPDAVVLVTPDAKALIPMGELIDLDAERKRLQKELDSADKELAFINAKLSNKDFTAKAPEEVVARQREAAAGLGEKIAMLRESIEKL